MSEKASSPSVVHHFVLVHGAGHGAWCWFKLRQLLEAAGHRVTCLDLASAGIHQSNPGSILSFEDYDEPLFNFMSALPPHEQVILVGHSAGGLSVTHAMHEFAEKIVVAIFIAATMLESGFVSEEDIKDGVPDLSTYGDVFECQFSSGTNNPPTAAAFRKEFQRKLLYQLSPEEYSTLASMLLRPWPAQVFSNARFEGGKESVNKVRRVYIKTTQDNVLKPEQQEVMIRRWPPNEEYVIHTDHSPFFSSPEQLLKLLIQASASSKSSD